MVIIEDHQFCLVRIFRASYVMAGEDIGISICSIGELDGMQGCHIDSSSKNNQMEVEDNDNLTIGDKRRIVIT